MDEDPGPGCPTCGDVAVEVTREGDVLTMACADPQCGRQFTIRRGGGLTRLPSA